jgi:hypothetical protein
MSVGKLEYFVLWYRLYAKDGFAIYISGDKDSMAVGPDGFIPTFARPEILRRYVDINKYELAKEKPILHDLDWLANWKQMKSGSVDCPEALAMWNLFGDVANSLSERGAQFLDLDSQGRFRSIYNKLFWGNNLPAVTPEGCEYIPEWSSDEVASVAEILSAGLDMFISNTRYWSASPTPLRIDC